MNTKEYLLVCLSEELAETAQETSKCLRFTTGHIPACYETSNLERLQLEAMDVLAVSDLLMSMFGIDTGFTVDPVLMVNRPDLAKRFSEKRQRTLELLDVAKSLGAVR